MQLSWSKSLVRKWFNIRGKSHDFHADAVAAGTGRSGESGSCKPVLCLSLGVSALWDPPLTSGASISSCSVCHWKITLLFLPPTLFLMPFVLFSSSSSSAAAASQTVKGLSFPVHVFCSLIILCFCNRTLLRQPSLGFPFFFKLNICSCRRWRR